MRKNPFFSLNVGDFGNLEGGDPKKWSKKGFFCQILTFFSLNEADSWSLEGENPQKTPFFDHFPCLNEAYFSLNKGKTPKIPHIKAKKKAKNGQKKGQKTPKNPPKTPHFRGPGEKSCTWHRNPEISLDFYGEKTGFFRFFLFLALFSPILGGFWL